MPNPPVLQTKGGEIWSIVQSNNFWLVSQWKNDPRSGCFAVNNGWQASDSMECVVPIINGLQVEQIVVVDLVIINIEPFQFVNLNILMQTFRYFAN